MSKKNGASSPREGTASAVREAARSGDLEKSHLPRAPELHGWYAAQANNATITQGENPIRAESMPEP
jgi:hypothetical protein